VLLPGPQPDGCSLEETLSLLEACACTEDASALCTPWGMSAIKQACEPLLAMRKRGDERIHFVSGAQVCRRTFQLLNLPMRERGADLRRFTQPRKIAASGRLKRRPATRIPRLDRDAQRSPHRTRLRSGQEDPEVKGGVPLPEGSMQGS